MIAKRIHETLNLPPRYACKTERQNTGQGQRHHGVENALFHGGGLDQRFETVAGQLAGGICDRLCRQLARYFWTSGIQGLFIKL